MEKFLEKYGQHLTGTGSGFERVIFKGYLPLGWPEAMESLWARQGLRIMDFKRFVTDQSARFKKLANAVCEKAGRPHRYLRGREKKEPLGQKMIRQEPLTAGLVCVLSAVEPCQSFVVVPGEKRPQLQAARRKCLCFYFYYLDREFGLMHVRIQSWFPLTIQIYVNGHDGLARQMTKRGVTSQQVDNAFVELGDAKAAQKLADQFVNLPWPRRLDVFAQRVNPLLSDVLQGADRFQAPRSGSSRDASRGWQLGENVRQVPPHPAHREGDQSAVGIQSVSDGAAERCRGKAWASTCRKRWTWLRRANRSANWPNRRNAPTAAACAASTRPRVPTRPCSPPCCAANTSRMASATNRSAPRCTALCPRIPSWRAANAVESPDYCNASTRMA